MLIDIGVNLSNSRFSGDIENVLLRAEQSNVKKIVLTGTSVTETEACIELCEKYKGQFPGMLYATAGIHPHEASSFNNSAINAIAHLAQHPSIVAIGETGLDFNRNLSPEKMQESAFEAQIELAENSQLPLFLHERDASKRQLEILTSYQNSLPKAVIHCFTGDKRTLFSYLDLDLYIGITGWICDERRGSDLQSIVKNVPLHRLMVETDAPYLLPRNMPQPPKNRCNEPANLTYVIEGIAAHREESVTILAESSSATAIEFFNLGSWS
jgi:TatD DNase family protein|tara:strand:- start:6281 stop:7087 length:807 start_codon:yes stop_codon:yes gene_type:complete